MFSQRVTNYPAAGKGPELRTLLEERVKARQAKGLRTGLSTQMFGADGAAYVITTTYADLAALEKSRRENQSDPASRAFQAKLAGLQRVPQTIELFEILMPAPAAAAEPIFSHRVTQYPAAGKGPELRALLEGRVKDGQAQGLRVGLSTQLFGAGGATYVQTVIYPDLAAYEKRRQANLSDSAFRAYQAKVVELTRMPAKQELFEILVRVPPM